MDDSVSRFITDLIGRTDGPMSFRVYIQPIMAIVFAIRDGRRDCREGRGPFGWALLTDPEHRSFLIRDGWKGISKVFVFAYLLDLVYQFVALHGFRFAQALFTAVLLAIVPYVLLRGPAGRVTSFMSTRTRSP
jgi:hypothetical protein